MFLIHKLSLPPFLLLTTLTTSTPLPSPLSNTGTHTTSWTTELTRLRDGGIDTQPSNYCKPSDDSADCFFVSQVQQFGDKTDWILMNHKCAQLGMVERVITNQINFFPRPGNPNIWIDQSSASVPPKMTLMAGDVLHDRCWNAGAREGEPGFRLACHITFRCP